MYDYFMLQRSHDTLHCSENLKAGHPVIGHPCLSAIIVLRLLSSGRERTFQSRLAARMQ